MKKPISNLQYKRFKEGDRFKRFGETWFTSTIENQIVCFLQHRFTTITFANHGYALDCNQKWWPMWNHQGPAPTTYLLPVPKNIVIRPWGQRCNKRRLVIPPCSSLHLQPPSTVTTWVQLTPNRQKLDRDVEAPAKMNGRMCKTEHNYWNMGVSENGYTI